MDDLSKFLQGFHRFKQKYFADDKALYERLTQEGQKPSTLVIGCCDARVDPALITDCAPGDMFVIRNVANLVPPREVGPTNQGVSAALEFGVSVLNVERIIVLGHAHCGGIASLMKDDMGTASAGYLARWIGIAEPARQRVWEEFADKPIEEQIRACEMASILVSLNNLLTFPWIRERVEQGQLNLHGWYFDIEQGDLLGYHPPSGEFISLGGK
ncbi:carbonic anhydrase [Chitinivorax tropicus]|uniref:Carbonic anhydrase n=1 Tax=Chitinivorax tropicus TaxID=714531 RepID=A0A840MZ94_9PROT|nr:carbonic anhydrase [Chitinivorax tropicus]MBB5020471.1 carbonic anhydrase [Chitinivorax tropicus]